MKKRLSLYTRDKRSEYPSIDITIGSTLQLTPSLCPQCVRKIQTPVHIQRLIIIKVHVAFFCETACCEKCCHWYPLSAESGKTCYWHVHLDACQFLCECDDIASISPFPGFVITLLV